MKTTSLKLPEALLSRLEAAAKARGVSKSQMIREGLEMALADFTGHASSCYDLAHDLIGSGIGLPKDIPTNPRHMGGFGR